MLESERRAPAGLKFARNVRVNVSSEGASVLWGLWI